MQWEADLLENLRRRRPQLTEQELKDSLAANFRTATGLKMAEKTLLS